MLGWSWEEIVVSQKEWCYLHFTYCDLLICILEIVLLSSNTQSYDFIRAWQSVVRLACFPKAAVVTWLVFPYCFSLEFDSPSL